MDWEDQGEESQRRGQMRKRLIRNQDDYTATEYLNHIGNLSTQDAAQKIYNEYGVV